MKNIKSHQQVASCTELNGASKAHRKKNQVQEAQQSAWIVQNWIKVIRDARHITTMIFPRATRTAKNGLVVITSKSGRSEP